MAKSTGRLDVVATPIGNLADLGARARESLAAADLIAAEDTRHTLALLQSIGVSRPLVSLHDHNETRRIPELLQRLAAGERIALVSDAGTPVVSDPGFALIRAVASAGYDVCAIPGPSAVITAIAVSGLPSDRFTFEGFLPSKPAERRAALEALAAETRTLVFFESPHRVAASLADLAHAFGAGREAVVARELTKLHETIYRGTLAELAARAAGDANFQRGELTLVVRGAPPESASAGAPGLRRTVELLARELPPGKAASLAAQITGARRSDAYALALSLSAAPSSETDA